MDELMDRRLREQEQELRATMEVFAQAAQRMNALGSGVGWIGPASAAYDLAVITLRAELRLAEEQLGAALAGTVNALSTNAGAPGQHCG